MPRFALYIFLTLLICGCSPKDTDVSVKVITFNIRYDNAADGVNSWPRRAAQAASFLKEEKPGLIGMQEVLLKQYSYLDSALAGYGSVAVGRNDGLQGGEMNPVFYDSDRFSLAETNTFWLSETPQTPGSKAWGSSLPRIVTWVKLTDKVTGSSLFYFNTHFAHDSDSARVRSSMLILEEVQRIAGDAPLVITGDLNMTPESKGYSILTENGATDALLLDSYLESIEKPVGPKYTFNGFTDNTTGGRIDYIFVRNGSKVLTNRTIWRKEGGIYISDHWPVVSTIVPGAD